MPFTVYAQLEPERKTLIDVHTCRRVLSAPGSRPPAFITEEGHRVVVHQALGKKYEEVVVDVPVIPETLVRGVSVRNVSAGELRVIKGVLDRLPEHFIREFIRRRNGIVCVDWTGQAWDPSGRPGAATLLSAGANMRAERTRGGITEAGERIEITHAAMHEAKGDTRRGVYTLLHELGHVAFDASLAPPTVQDANYGSSIHVGASEQPAYAFMWYFIRPARLTPGDRAALTRLLGPVGGAAPPAPAAGPPSIRESVGEGANNRPDDVRVVQILLNLWSGARMSPLMATGVCDAEMVRRIRSFQKSRLGVATPDGRVDPGGRTLRALEGGG